MGLFSKWFGGGSDGGGPLNEEQRGECEKMVELVDAAYMLSITSEMSFGAEAPQAGQAVRDAYRQVDAKMGKKGTKAVYDICLERQPTMLDFLDAHWG